MCMIAIIIIIMNYYDKAMNVLINHEFQNDNSRLHISCLYDDRGRMSTCCCTGERRRRG